MVTSLVLDLDELDLLARLGSQEALKEVVPLLSHLSRERTFLGTPTRPLLQQGQNALSPEPYVALHRLGSDNSYSLQLFVWPPHAKTQIHDHSCWGAFACATGSLLEERYDRLDDGSEPNKAHLKKSWRRLWDGGAGVSTLLPYDGGIHRVVNLSDKPVLSVHLYGPPEGVDGRDYDPLHDYVCDRLVGD